MDTWWYSNIEAVICSPGFHTITWVAVGKGVSVGIGVSVGKGVLVGVGVSVAVGVLLGGMTLGVLVIAWKGVGVVVAESVAVGDDSRSIELTIMPELNEHPTIDTDNPTIMRRCNIPGL